MRKLTLYLSLLLVPLGVSPLFSYPIDVTTAPHITLDDKATLSWAFSVWNYAYHADGDLPTLLFVRASGPDGQTGSLSGELVSIDATQTIPFTFPWSPDVNCGSLGCSVVTGAAGWVDIPAGFFQPNAAGPLRACRCTCPPRARTVRDQ